MTQAKITITRTGGTNTAAGELISAATAAKTVTPVASITELGNTLMAAISDQLKPVIGTAATNAAGAALPLLQWAGYSPGTQDEQALRRLAWAYALLPCALKLVAASLLHWLLIDSPDHPQE